MEKRERARLLRESWPELFGQEYPKPLKLGIKEDLIADAAARQIDFPEKELGKALGRYTRTIQYHLALTKDPLRYDIHGHPAGEVTEEQRNHSLEWLEKNPKYTKESASSEK